MSSISRKIATLIAALVLSGCGLLLPDEMSGVLEVVVINQDEQPLADVTVAIWHEDRKRGGKTGDDGTYVQQHLVRGSYRVEVAGQSESCSVRERETTQCRFVVGDSP